jgi:N-dimethylarginine dimethylaminohydrolase
VRRLVVAPWLLTWDLREQLLQRGFELIVAETLDEVGRLGTNFVAVAPDEVVMAEGFPDTLALLREHGVRVHLVAMDEILRGGGSIHCCTGFLRRDPV